LPEEWREPVAAATATDPGARYDSIDAFWEAIDAAGLAGEARRRSRVAAAKGAKKEGIKISVKWQNRISIFSWVLGGLLLAVMAVDFAMDGAIRKWMWGTGTTQESGNTNGGATRIDAPTPAPADEAETDPAASDIAAMNRQAGQARRHTTRALEADTEGEILALLLLATDATESAAAAAERARKAVPTVTERDDYRQAVAALDDARGEVVSTINVMAAVIEGFAETQTGEIADSDAAMRREVAVSAASTWFNLAALRYYCAAWSAADKVSDHAKAAVAAHRRAGELQTGYNLAPGDVPEAARALNRWMRAYEARKAEVGDAGGEEPGNSGDEEPADADGNDGATGEDAGTGSAPE
jgi:hypothetical protein